MLPLIAPVVLLVLLLFWSNRGEKKRREKIESELKKGDSVLTRAGLVGKVKEITGSTVRLEIAPGVVVTMLMSAIEGPAEVEQVKGKSDATPAKAAAGKKK